MKAMMRSDESGYFCLSGARPVEQELPAFFESICGVGFCLCEMHHLDIWNRSSSLAVFFHSANSGLNT
jgi:hypothetical protein